MAAGRSTRTRERRDRTAEVLDAAIQVFYAKGYADASMQDVADRVGVLKGSLYHYVASKEDLLFNVLNASHEEALTIMRTVEEHEGGADEKLCLYLSLLSSWYLANIERVSIYFKEGSKLSGPRADQVRVERRRTLAFLQNLLDDAQKQGLVRKDVDTRLAALMIFGQLNSFPDWYRRRGPDTARSVTHTFTRLVLASLSAPVPAVMALVDTADAVSPTKGATAQWTKSTA